MRDLFVFGIVLLSLPFGFRVPFVGLLTFTWLAYMRAQDLCWGFARSQRFSLWVGLVMILGWAVHEAGKRPFTRRDFRATMMILLLILTTISLALATDQSSYVITRYVEYAKIIVVALFTLGQVDSRKRLKLMLLTIALSLGFFGIKGGIHGILTGGGTIQRGPGGMLEDNNDFALALVMNVPLMLYLGLEGSKPWMRRLAITGVVLTMGTITLTHSRGAFLALAGVMLLLWLRSRRKGMGAMILVGAALAFFVVLPKHVRSRIASIGHYKQDSSAMGRLQAWQIAFREIKAYPILGVGIRNYQVHWDEFKEGIVSGEAYAKVAHNSYLQVWAEGGTIAFLVYLAMLFSSFATLRKLRRLGMKTRGGEWISNYARMFEASLLGYMIGATFLNRGHFDLIYHLVALVAAFRLIAYRWVKQPEGQREGEDLEVDEMLPLRLGDGAGVAKGRPSPALPHWGR